MNALQSWGGDITVSVAGSTRTDYGYGYYSTASLNSNVSARAQITQDLPQHWQGPITPSGNLVYLADTYFNFPSKDFTTEWNYTASGSMDVVGPGLQHNPAVSIQITVDPQSCTYNLFINDEVFGTQKISSRQPDGSVQTTTQNNAALIWGAYPGELQVIGQPIPANPSSLNGSLSFDYQAYVDVATTIPAHVVVSWSLSQMGLACGDDRDALIKEYADYGVTDSANSWAEFHPQCVNFTQSASSVNFTFQELNTPAPSQSAEYDWALIRYPLVAVAPLIGPGIGLNAWVTLYGSSRVINSAYRDPRQNNDAGGAASSRHMFGDAVDLRNESHPSGSRTSCNPQWPNKPKSPVNSCVAEYNKMVKSAWLAGASYIEPPSLPCGYNCVHADWRLLPGPYAR